MEINFKQKSPRFKVINRIEFIMDRIHRKTILHLGAVDFYNNSIAGLHKKLMTVANKVVGIDIDKEGIEKAKMQGIHNILYCDVEKDNLSFLVQNR